MECGNAITRMKALNLWTHGIDCSSNIITGIPGFLVDIGALPVLGVGARENDFDEDFVGFRFRDRRVHDLDFGSCADKCFLHDDKVGTIGGYWRIWEIVSRRMWLSYVPSRLKMQHCVIGRLAPTRQANLCKGELSQPVNLWISNA